MAHGHSGYFRLAGQSHVARGAWQPMVPAGHAQPALELAHATHVLGDVATEAAVDGRLLEDVVRGMAGGPKRAVTQSSAGGTTVLRTSAGGGELRDGRLREFGSTLGRQRRHNDVRWCSRASSMHGEDDIS
jgi:hypothetical protein